MSIHVGMPRRFQPEVVECGNGNLCSDGVLGIMQMKRKTIAGIVIIVMLVLLVITGFYNNQIPYHTTNSAPVSVPADHGSGTPDFFVIYNKDSNNSHEVAIEIFNSDNESIIKELYILNQSESIKQTKLPIMTTPYSRLYTVKVVLDNETTDIRSIRMDPWANLFIELYRTSTDYDTEGQIIPETSGKIIPLEISVTTV